MTATSPVFVSQVELAKDLNLSDRRIRQLVEERILPPAREEGHDQALSRERYRIYSNGSERDWGRCFDEAEDAARLAGELTHRAHEADADLDDVRAASIAVQRSTELMSFLTACKSKSDTERKMFWGWWDREEGQALGELLARGMKLIGKTHFLSDDGELIEMVPPEVAAQANRKARRKTGRVKKPSGRRRA